MNWGLCLLTMYLGWGLFLLTMYLGQESRFLLPVPVTFRGFWAIRTSLAG